MAVARRGTQGALLAGMLLAGIAQAQQAAPVSVPDPAPVPPADAPAAATAPISTALPQDNVTTLGEVRALKPDDEPLDLYRFKNPVKFGDNRFSRDWSEPPSPEQVSMGGGYIMMGVVKGVLAAGRGLNKLTGGPDQIQSAIARPPPELSPEQRQRALRFSQQQDAGDAPPVK
ncbi:hypothetical protein D7U93_07735 [Stenotrophomonas maltophilia]|uniref:hypothetical protein n=1 Tax=Stenotrophomonas TaxID=40323 RepID=UPI0005A41BBB|nr:MULTISPECIES: hypothetical protein [unclassified Stenotrophomonas]KKF90102.1 hypothetical protein XY58_00345 [Stenotrophomonas maltophilia]MBA0257301.1 hypothetical protein [Stenotrophomonas maltophilia]MBA0379259.1 hypothetical protein [Stenotrophomonas maltophilia]MBA0407949.1 hypothetical protein [Stenotrophomonas maltophilia]MBA0425454.1 hypothetical protein [Stenotrophomonas maltophilia]